MDQLERLIFVDRLLSERRTGISFGELQDRMKEQGLRCTRSTLRRVLAFLRTLGAPLRHDAERGGYFYEPGTQYKLPGLWFTAQELSALLILEEIVEQQPFGLLSETLRPFRTRLEKLADHSGVGIPEWRTRLRLLRMSARSAGTELPIVAQALAERRHLRIDYHARSDDRMAPRIVSPQRLTLYRDNWYLDAWCHMRKDLRIFSLDRIIAAQMLDEPAHDVPMELLDEILATSYGIFSGRPSATAVLRFSPHAARWVSTETWHPEQEDARDPDGALIRKLPYHRDEELLMDILRHGADVEVLAPSGLRQTVIARLQSALDRYTAVAAAANAPRVAGKPARTRFSI